MRGQRGFTLVEVMAATFILALLTTGAVWSIVGFTASVKTEKVVSRFLDSASLAREKAVGRYEQWRIVFPTPPPGSTMVTSYRVESCRLPAGPAGVPCSGTWTLEEEVELNSPDGEGPRLGLNFPGGVPAALHFDRTGQFLGSTTEIQVCQAVYDDFGALVCRPGSTGRLIRIHGFSGIIES